MNLIERLKALRDSFKQYESNCLVNWHAHLKAKNHIGAIASHHGAMAFERCKSDLDTLIREAEAEHVSAGNQIRSDCPKCGHPMTLHFYNRGPNDPPGNQYICDNCPKAEAEPKGDVVDEELCQHCGKDLVQHHHRNLKCPIGETVYRSSSLTAQPTAELEREAREWVAKENQFDNGTEFVRQTKAYLAGASRRDERGLAEMVLAAEIGFDLAFRLSGEQPPSWPAIKAKARAIAGKEHP